MRSRHCSFLSALVKWNMRSSRAARNLGCGVRFEPTRSLCFVLALISHEGWGLGACVYYGRLNRFRGSKEDEKERRKKDRHRGGRGGGKKRGTGTYKDDILQCYCQLSAFAACLSW